MRAVEALPGTVPFTPMSAVKLPTPPRPRQQPDSRMNPWAMLGVVAELIVGMVAFGLLGWWVDRRYETQPWFLVAGILVGLIGGLYSQWRRVSD